MTKNFIITTKNNFYDNNFSCERTAKNFLKHNKLTTYLSKTNLTAYL